MRFSLSRLLYYSPASNRFHYLTPYSSVQPFGGEYILFVSLERIHNRHDLWGLTELIEAVQGNAGEEDEEDGESVRNVRPGEDDSDGESVRNVGRGEDDDEESGEDV